jgi:pyridoxamine 5'-phosphate oxidase
VTEPCDPIALFKEWAALAVKAQVPEPDAASLATVDDACRPSVRLVMVRGVDERGFVFYTNLRSRKSRELLAGGADGAPAALTWWWPGITKQVRVEGSAVRVSEEESDAYWATRPRESQVGAWASDQSAELPGGYSELASRFHELSDSMPENVPRPPHWGGFRVIPREIEFWDARPHRLHHRVLYTRQGKGWETKVLSP